MSRPWLFLLLALVASLAASRGVLAQASNPDGPTADEVNRIAKKLYCPVCPNTPLDVCETQACQDWRAQIRDQLAKGWSEAQILDYFVAQYGERVLAEPERKGFTSLVWLLPALVVAVGLITATQVLRGWRGARSARAGPEEQGRSRAAAQTLQVDQDVLARIEGELDRIA